MSTFTGRLFGPGLAGTGEPVTAHWQHDTVFCQIPERTISATGPLRLSEGGFNATQLNLAWSDTEGDFVLSVAAGPQRDAMVAGLPAALQTQWAQARRGDERLVVAGLDASRVPNPGDGVELVGKLGPEQYRDLLGRSKLFLCAPRREDYGIAQLEALADGCQLVTTEAPGGYEALALARELDARLVGDDLTSAIRTALDDPRPDYFVRAAELLEPYSPAAVQRIVNEQLLARLLG